MRPHLWVDSPLWLGTQEGIRKGGVTMVLDHQEQGPVHARALWGEMGFLYLLPLRLPHSLSTPHPSHPIPPVAVSEGLAEIGRWEVLFPKSQHNRMEAVGKGSKA